MFPSVVPLYEEGICCHLVKTALQRCLLNLHEKIYHGNTFHAAYNLQRTTCTKRTICNLQPAYNLRRTKACHGWFTLKFATFFAAFTFKNNPGRLLSGILPLSVRRLPERLLNVL